MSVVTNVILTFGWQDEAKRVLSSLRGFGLQRGMKFLCGPEDAGGGKVLEANVAVAAFNHLDHEEFWASLQGLKWEDPVSVRIMIQGEDDDCFRVYDLFRNELVVPDEVKARTLVRPDLR